MRRTMLFMPGSKPGNLLNGDAYGADSIMDTILNHKALGDGAIILMHNGAKYTKDALERVITGLQDKGYEIVPISQLIYTGKYHMDNTGRQFKDE